MSDNADQNARAPLAGSADPDKVATSPAPHSPGAAPMREMKADLVVIGAGSAGLSAAAGAAQFGLSVVLYEKGEMGGDCLNSGCVPSKALLSAAKAAAQVREAGKFGIETTPPRIDWEKVKLHVRTSIATIAPVDSQERFEGLGCTVIREHAKFASPDTVISPTTRVKARRIIIATGSRAFIPPIEGLANTPYLTNETIFDLPDFPEHLVILGGGPIGMEMAQAFVRLGAKVTVIEMGKALGRSDRAHAEIAIEALRAEGVTLLEGYKATKVEQDGKTIRVHTEPKDGEAWTVEGSHLLVAVGRQTVFDGMDLDKGDVDHDRKGIIVGDNLRSASNRRVWALGDAAGREQFTHIAGWHASVFARRAFFKQRTKADSLPVPAVTYTSPEVAQLGLTEAEAREKHGDDITTPSFQFEESDRAIAEADTDGEVKLIVRKGKLLGASIVGKEAGDLLQLVSVAMSNGLGVKELTNFISPNPTRAEGVKRAANAHYADVVFGKSAKRLVGLLQRIP
ncbi:MAG: dihydrolipoamide dehydrogenase [Hyphomonas sp.]|nr:dihydrolipoamide dehydrogenase [Hyphomonas sp.]